jgi:hypothetical protein
MGSRRLPDSRFRNGSIRRNELLDTLPLPIETRFF